MLQFGNLGTRRRRLAHGQVILITRPGDPPSSRPTETGQNTTGQTQGDANGGDRLLETWVLLSKRYKNNQHWKVYSLKNLQTCKSVSQLQCSGKGARSTVCELCCERHWNGKPSTPQDMNLWRNQLHILSKTATRLIYEQRQPTPNKTHTG